MCTSQLAGMELLLSKKNDHWHASLLGPFISQGQITIIPDQQDTYSVLLSSGADTITTCYQLCVNAKSSTFVRTIAQ